MIDLRNDDELDPDVAHRPSELTTVHLPLDGREHHDFWAPWLGGEQYGTPLYYRPHLEQLPERSGAVLRAIARAAPGGVAYHCVGGRDRTGQITILLLALAGAPAQEIVADYELSDGRLTALYESWGQPDRARSVQDFLAEQGTSASELIRTLLQSLELEPTLASGGLGQEDLSALRARLVDQYS